MCNSEDVDIDESEEFPYDRNNIYVFNSNDSVLITNKGKTKREDFSIMHWGTTKDHYLMNKQHHDISDNEIKGDISVTYEIDPDIHRRSLQPHIKLSNKNHGESCYKKCESSQLKNQSATGISGYTPINSFY